MNATWETPDTGGLDTTEVRWFGAGSLPESLAAWFMTPAATVERRCDAYLIGTGPDVGVKRRDGGPLEIKTRLGRAGVVTLRDGTSGRTELWRKHAGPGTNAGATRWVDVDKIVYRRRFALVGRTARPVESMVRGGYACHVELAAVSAVGVDAWTFAVEAWGPEETRGRLVTEALAAFAAETPFRDELVDGLVDDLGYPAWIDATLNPSDPAG